MRLLYLIVVAFRLFEWKGSLYFNGGVKLSVMEVNTMKISKSYLLLILISILLLMSGCNDVPLTVLSEEKLDEEIAYWSSEKFKGRQTGTQGNINARNEIAKQFNKIELEPLSSKNYLMPFSMSFNDPKEIQTKIHV